MTWIGNRKVVIAAASLTIILHASVVGPVADGQEAGDLSTRYRLLERYSLADPPEAGTIGPYRLGIREETSSSSGERGAAGGGPGFVRQIICDERPALLGSYGDQVQALVRRYERLQVSPDFGKPPVALPVEGLTLWCRPQPTGGIQVLSLAESRPLGAAEYGTASTQIFAPDLASLLPFQAVRVGDSWPLPRTALRTLIGTDQISEGGLEATLREVLPGGGGGDRTASIAIQGRPKIDIGSATVEIAFRGEARFRFLASRPSGADVEARGFVSRLSLAKTESLLDPNGRRGGRREGELIVERQVGGLKSGLAIPSQPPKPSPSNSWLTYSDPRGRFRFRHPQDLVRPQDLGQPPTESPDQVELLRLRAPGEFDVFKLEVLPNTVQKPEPYEAERFADWKERGFPIVKGASGWRPESEWPGLRAYRFEAAISAPKSGNAVEVAPRLQVFDYVVQFRRNASLTAEVTTVQDPPTPVRDEAEAILKSFTWLP